MTEPAYLPRIVDAELEERLSSAGVVVIEGPKACGKTATARQVAASEVLLDVDASARRAAQVDPTLVLDGPIPRLIDEWQTVPSLWNHVRRAADDRGRPGQFILTGSAVPADDITRHSGAGRISRLRMRPMSLYETGHAGGRVSLADLFDGRAPRAPESELDVAAVAERVTVGGWPGNIHLDLHASIRAVRDYLEEIRRTDIVRVDGTRRDPERVGRVLRSLARNVSTHVATSTLASDAGGADGALDDGTVRDYVGALERLMIVEDQPAWAPHLRSRSILRKSARRHFADPSLAVAALRAVPERLLGDLELLGLLFESLVIRDLRIYGQALDARVYQYRDNTGLEADAILERADGRWIALEVKLASEGEPLDRAAEALLKLAGRVDPARTGRPAATVIVVPSGYGYVREDGVAVVPLGALGP